MEQMSACDVAHIIAGGEVIDADGTRYRFYTDYSVCNAVIQFLM
jgi:hypothetical protein